MPQRSPTTKSHLLWLEPELDNPVQQFANHRLGGNFSESVRFMLRHFIDTQFPFYGLSIETAVNPPAGEVRDA